VQTLILTLHIIVCVLLVILILLQAGKEGMGVIFGGGNASVFGSAGAGGILAKLTTLMAVVFVVTSLSYTYVTSSRPQSESAVLNVRIEDSAAPAADGVKSDAPENAPLVKPPVIAPPAAPAEEAKKTEPSVKPEQSAAQSGQSDARPQNAAEDKKGGENNQKAPPPEAHPDKARPGKGK
jgi:preprotein translocase subunit SecG